MLVTVQWRNIPRAAPVDVFMSLQLWKNRAIRPEFLVLKLEWKGIAFFFFFLIHQKEVTFEGHLLRIHWLILAMRYVRNNAVFCENSSEETEHLVFTEKLKKKKKYKSLC